MPPTTRAQTTREAIATSAEPHHAIASEDQIEESVQQRRSTASKKNSKSSLRNRYPDTPPRFVINLSLPPEQRYLEVCAAFKQEISDLTPLFDEVVGGMLQAVPLTWLHRACRLLLRGVYDPEENKELKGISKATGVAIYLLVCFNVLLDLFMGCSSGGAAIRDGDTGVKMLHFRTLDWGMPSLRKIVVQLDFVTQDGGPIVASSLTYAGYVGVLTGVKKDLSLSLNFRPNRLEKGKWMADVKYYWHLAMVLLGRRRSISSELRRFLLPKLPKHDPKAKEKEVSWTSPKYAEILEEIKCSGRKPLKTTACYLCFSNGQETTVFEKDYSTAVVRSSNELIVITNNDLEAESANSASREQTSQYVGALREILDEAQDRRKCAGDNYNLLKETAARRHRSALVEGDDSSRLLDVEHIVRLVQMYPTTNEETHFACVMDPQEGRVVWCRRWVNPISQAWIRDHWSPTSTW
ncbi:Acid ceramidase [Pseudocercospora fuligena]|uniref:ceramidase n=1 Tax=Pseudocercospora fuligena TaxID=685502 RepID=A0A8H6RNG8_9PEZI|nr:Acid ceramidase [Pseudocercospora fuligena]